MRLYRFDVHAGRNEPAFGSAGLTVTHLVRQTGSWHAVAFYLAPDGLVGAHAAAADQLFLVLAGGGAFSGADGATREAVPGSAAFWLAGEVHGTRAGPEGLTAIVLEGEGLEAAIALPPWDAAS